MRTLRSITFLLFVLCSFSSFSQFVKGTVNEKKEEGLEALPGVSIFWRNNIIQTITDQNGSFSISFPGQEDYLIFSFTGFQQDSILINKSNFQEEVNILLKAGKALDEVSIEVRNKSTQISLISPKKTELIGENELRKAACCNLSESFETSPSVDVSFTDAATGTRQIKMLGLSGKYSQISIENIPDSRGLSTLTGMQAIPGSWVSGIQLNKGAGSVVNGYESVTGQINAELFKPEGDKRFHFNLYGNAMGRIEGNYIARKKFSDSLSTALMVHHNHMTSPHDNNNDGFHDHLIGDGASVLNRWRFIAKNNWRGQFILRSIWDEKNSGSFNPSTSNPFLVNLKENHNEAWMKLGYLFPNSEFASIGTQWKVAYKTINYQFGDRAYVADQSSAYFNFIYENIIGNTNHHYKTGASWTYDELDEELVDFDFLRKEWSSGAYFEYNFKRGENFDYLLGVREDYNNFYGWLFTPRSHMRYALSENSTLRASGGKAYRTANVLAENYPYLASNRAFVIQGSTASLPYGLEMEDAWNYGLNYTHKLNLDYRELVIAVDFYRTEFQNQLVVDLFTNPQEVNFYNLSGKSFANSFQVQLDYELIKRLDFRTAYRWYDVQTEYQSVGLQSQALLPQHRAFVNLSYKTRNEWMFDATLNWRGSQIVPSKVLAAASTNSPAYSVVNAQVSKEHKEKFEVYLGVENLLDFKQNNPIIMSENPNDPSFDATMVWGPVFGRNIYFGIRMTLLGEAKKKATSH